MSSEYGIDIGLTEEVAIWIRPTKMGKGALLEQPTQLMVVGKECTIFFGNVAIDTLPLLQ